MAEIVEIFADTGVVIERDLTPEELAQRAADVAAAEQAAAEAWDYHWNRSSLRI